MSLSFLYIYILTAPLFNFHRKDCVVLLAFHLEAFVRLHHRRRRREHLTHPQLYGKCHIPLGFVNHSIVYLTVLVELDYLALRAELNVMFLQQPFKLYTILVKDVNVHKISVPCADLLFVEYQLQILLLFCKS